MTYENRIYHGRRVPRPDQPAWRYCRIFVEKPEHGPTQRESVTVLCEMTVTYDAINGVDYSNFEWGYDGGGPYRTAAALLADALDLGTPEDAGMAWWDGDLDEGMKQLCMAFRADVVVQLCDEWRLSAETVRRWARDWHLQGHVADMPGDLRRRTPLRSV